MYINTGGKVLGLEATITSSRVPLSPAGTPEYDPALAPFFQFRQSPRERRGWAVLPGRSPQRGFFGDEVDGYDPEADYSAPPNNPIVAPPSMPDWNPYAGIGGSSPSVIGNRNSSPPPYDPIGNANTGDKTIVNNGGGGGVLTWAGGILSPIVKAAVPIATAAGTRAILGSTAVVDPKTGLPVLSANTGQALYANSSGGVSTNPNPNATGLNAAMTPLLIGAGVVALVLLLKKK